MEVVSAGKCLPFGSHRQLVRSRDIGAGRQLPASFLAWHVLQQPVPPAVLPRQTGHNKTKLQACASHLTPVHNIMPPAIQLAALAVISESPAAAARRTMAQLAAAAAASFWLLLANPSAAAALAPQLASCSFPAAVVLTAQQCIAPVAVPPPLSTPHAGVAEAPSRMADQPAGLQRASVGFIAPLEERLPPPVVSSERGGSGGSLTIRFPAAKDDPDKLAAQKALVEAWGYVSTQFLDTAYNGVDWPAALNPALQETFEAPNAEAARGVTRRLLAKLGDPYTRIVPPSQSAAFENELQGQVVGLGMQLKETNSGSGSGPLRVAFVVERSPAYRAGILPGDWLVAINGEPVDATDKSRLLVQLRQEVDLKLLRDGLSPDARESVTGPSSSASALSLHLTPEPIEVLPVQYSLLDGDAGTKVGYVRLALFTENAPREVESALAALAKQGAASYVLDMRDNAGGMVYAGWRIASLLLGQGQPYVYLSDRDGLQEDIAITEPVPTPASAPGVRLAVLVNGGTASTSEMLAGALHDDRGALLVGESTLGKGRTQRAVPLADGSLLLLSNLRYTTPAHTPVDKVGLQPDVACRSEAAGEEFWASGETVNPLGEEGHIQDACLQLAVQELESKLAKRS